MRRPTAPPSYLPSMMLPCPTCGARWLVTSVEPDRVEDHLENITHGCARCGIELTRTRATLSRRSAPPEAAVPATYQSGMQRRSTAAPRRP